jgi:uncharacterized protein
MRTQRIRDPIHDIIVFDDRGLVDEPVWELLQIPDVQRLRRIKQLGLSEFVFPSATHTRFSHSVGVFHNARRLVGLIQREIEAGRVDGSFDEDSAKVALFAALLHDIGHGPFSHSFEEARKSLAGPGGIRKHEQFTADMIEEPEGRIALTLKNWGVEPTNVANLIRAEVPVDMYHAVVSSSFDADRLDYLVRDRYMTGTGAGAIDMEWLMDNVRVAEIDLSAPSEVGGDPEYRHSFCLSYKARDAAEDFLLARYRLYTNVYFHKTTRGIEQLISLFFRLIAQEVEAKKAVQGLADNHPLVKFFSPGGDTLTNYRTLDDAVVWGALHSIALAGSGDLKSIASRVLNRERVSCLDVQNFIPDDFEKQRRLKSALDNKFKDKLGRRVLRDTAELTLYGEAGADDTKAQKRLMIQLANGALKEITSLHDGTIVGSDKRRRFDRYFFLDEDSFAEAKTLAEEVGKRP